jgi:hypothetical protein
MARGDKLAFRPGPSRPKVLLDTNAVAYLFNREGFTSEELSSVRERIRRRAALDEVRPVLTVPRGWELAKFYSEPGFGPHSYREMIRFVVAVGAGWVLKNEYERMVLELRRRRKLTDAEAFDACDVETTLKDYCSDEVRIRNVQDMLRQQKEGERSVEREKREATQTDFEQRCGDGWRIVLARALEERWERTVASFARLEMRRFARQQNLRLVGAQWPHATSAPTFWYSESFYAAKVKRIFVDSQKDLVSNKSLKDMPDMVDATHFRDTAYVDALVTQDAVFAEVAKAARVRLAVVTFDDFARDVLASW